MRRLLVVAGLLSLVVSFSAAQAGPPHSRSGTRYPRVYGATGRPYGPTQAHYQYQRQYGRPWHGYGGLTTYGPVGQTTFRSSPFAHCGSYPYAYSGVGVYGTGGYFGVSAVPQYGFGYAYPPSTVFGPSFSYQPMAPLVMQGHPQWIGQNPFDNSVLNNARQENAERWEGPLPANAATPLVAPPIKPSTPEAQLRSIREQAKGDVWMNKQEYHQAYQKYKLALAQAEDRTELRFRIAYSLIAMQRYASALKYIKRGLQLDPTWPATGESLTEVYGAENLIAKNSFLQHVAAWVRDDIRNPDRLFLMGMLLHFDGDDRQAAPFFETAIRLTGGEEHLYAFVDQRGVPAAAQTQKPIEPQVIDIPPAPLPAEKVPPAVPQPPQPPEPDTSSVQPPPLAAPALVIPDPQPTQPQQGVPGVSDPR